jgi:hypothetical protein
MSLQTEERKMKVFTRVYDTYSQAEQAVGALEAAGVASSDISLVANKVVSDKYDKVDEVSGTATGAGVGAALGGGVGLLTGLGLMAIPGLGPVVAAGWLAATALGAAAGTAAGGLIGALAEAGVPERDAQVYSEAVRRGGTLMTVRTDMSDAQVNSLLDKYGPMDPNSRRIEYEQKGWKSFDPAAPPYQFDATEVEKLRRPYR